MRNDREKIVEDNKDLLQQIHSGDLRNLEFNKFILVSRLRTQGLYSKSTGTGDIIRPLINAYKKKYAIE